MKKKPHQKSANKALIKKFNDNLLQDMDNYLAGNEWYYTMEDLSDNEIDELVVSFSEKDFPGDALLKQIQSLYKTAVKCIIADLKEEKEIRDENRNQDLSIGKKRMEQAILAEELTDLQKKKLKELYGINI